VAYVNVATKKHLSGKLSETMKNPKHYDRLQPKFQLRIDTGKQLAVWVTSQFYEIDSDSTSHSKRILPLEINHLDKNIISLSIKRNLKTQKNIHVTTLCIRLHDFNCCPDFSKAWPKLQPRPLRAARNGRSRAKQFAQI
jgi:hypothetical protein